MAASKTKSTNWACEVSTPRQPEHQLPDHFAAGGPEAGEGHGERRRRQPEIPDLLDEAGVVRRRAAWEQARAAVAAKGAQAPARSAEVLPYLDAARRAEARIPAELSAALNA
jgi:hypothetical protein